MIWMTRESWRVWGRQQPVLFFMASDEGKGNCAGASSDCEVLPMDQGSTPMRDQMKHFKPNLFRDNAPRYIRCCDMTTAARHSINILLFTRGDTGLRRGEHSSTSV